MRILLILFSLLIIAIPTWGRTSLSVVAQPSHGEIRFDNNRALVLETRTISLMTGENQIGFSWSAIDLEPESIHLNIEKSGAKLSTTHLPAGEQALIWQITAPKAVMLNAQIRYLIDSFDQLTEYRGVISADEQTIGLQTFRVLRNFSGADFTDLLIVDDKKRVDIKNGQTRLYPTGTIQKMRVKKRVVWDSRIQSWEPPAGSRGGLPLYYQFDANQFAAPPADGKIRIFLTNDSGEELFGGEARLTLPVDEDFIRLQIGQSSNIRVTQLMTSQQKLNPRPSANQPLMYDIEEERTATIENHGSSLATLELVQYVEGEWQPIEPEPSFKRIGINKARFTVEIPAGDSKQVVFTYLRRNVKGGR